MTTRQRLWVQKGQVDTQWEMTGGQGPLPSSDEVAQYDTTDAQGADTVQTGPGGADWQGQKNEAGEPVWLQNDEVQTQESYTVGPRYDSAVSEAYADNWDDLN